MVNTPLMLCSSNKNNPLSLSCLILLALVICKYWAEDYYTVLLLAVFLRNIFYLWHMLTQLVPIFLLMHSNLGKPAIVLYVKAIMPVFCFREYPSLWVLSAAWGGNPCVHLPDCPQLPQQMCRPITGVMAKENTESETMLLQPKALFSTHYSGIGVSTHGVNQG